MNYEDFVLGIANNVVQPAVDYFSPDLYKSDSGGRYSDRNWEEWYERSSLYGTPEYAKHMDFLGMAGPKLDAYLAPWLASRSEEARARIRESIKEVAPLFRAKILGIKPPINVSPEGEQLAQTMVNDFLSWMRDTSIIGDDRPDTGVTPDEAESFRQDPSFRNRANADWRLTDTGVDAAKKLLDYNLFATFQTGLHSPEPLQGAAINAIGAGLGVAYENLPLTSLGSVRPDSLPGDQIARKQLGFIMSPDPGSALDYTMEVMRYAERKDPRFFNDWASGSYLPQFSAMTASGLSQKSESGNTRYGRATRYLTTPVMMNNFNRDERGALVDVLNDIDRLTPIRPEGTADEINDLRVRGTKLEGDNWRQVSARLPMWIRYLNQGLQEIPTSPQAWAGDVTSSDPSNPWFGPTDRPENAPEPSSDPGADGPIVPFHSTAAFNDALMVVPGIAGDPINAGVAALTGVGSLGLNARARVPILKNLASSGRAAAKAEFGDVKGEMGYNTGISLSMTPQTMQGYLSDPDPNNPIRDQYGQTPQADSPRYRSLFEDWSSDRQDTVTDTMDFRKRYPKRKIPTGRARTLPRNR